MTIQSINLDTCVRCGECVQSCPMDVIRWDKAAGAPKIEYPEDCQTCHLCEEFCPTTPDPGTITVSKDKCDRPMVGWG